MKGCADKQSEDTLSPAMGWRGRKERRESHQNQDRRGRAHLAILKELNTSPLVLSYSVCVYKYECANQRKCVMENMIDKFETWGRNE